MSLASRSTIGLWLGFPRRLSHRALEGDGDLSPGPRYPPWLPPMPPLGQAARPLVNCELPPPFSLPGRADDLPSSPFLRGYNVLRKSQRQGATWRQGSNRAGL